MDNNITKELVELLQVATSVISSHLSSSSSSDVVPEHSLIPEKFRSVLSDLYLLKLPSSPQKKNIEILLDYSLKFSVNSLSPGFLDKLYAGASPIGIIAELLIAVLNSNAHTYAVSPFFSIIERTVIEEMGSIVGFQTTVGGCFCPGGAYSNLHAMLTARNAMFPDISLNGMKEIEGIGGEFPSSPQSTKSHFHYIEILQSIIPYRHVLNTGPLVILTSSHSHFSILRSAVTIGIGHNHVRSVPVDSFGRMDVRELESMIKSSLSANERPFFVNATAGTTVLGSFDDLELIHKVCEEYKLWMHVDASWGGSVIFHKDRGKQLLKGLNTCDSVTINPHKLLGVPLLCSALLMKDKNIMRVNSVSAKYLFHGNEYDIGKWMIGCGRKPDAFKFWLCWMYTGSDGFHDRLEHAFQMVSYTLTRFNSNFELVVEPNFLNVCFWCYPKLETLPEEVMNLVKGEKGCHSKSVKEIIAVLKKKSYSKYHQFVSDITIQKHYKLLSSRKFMVDYATIELVKETELENLPYFFRLVFNAPTVQKNHIDQLVELIDSF